MKQTRKQAVTAMTAVICVMALAQLGCTGPQQASATDATQVAHGRGQRLAERGPATGRTIENRAKTPENQGRSDEPTSTTPITVSVQKGAAAQVRGPWKVNLSPPARVDDRFRMQVTARMQQLTIRRLDGNERKSEVRRTLVVDATAKVLEINTRGQVIRSTYVVQSCIGTGAKGEYEVVPSGTVLTVRRSGPKPRIDSSDGTLTRLQLAMLGLVFVTSEPKATDQSMFGTNALVQVGEQWTIDTDKTAELLMSAGAMVDPADLSGQTTLQEAKPCGATTCLRLLTQFSTADVRMKAVPPQATVVDSGVTGSSQRTLPLDPRKGIATNTDNFELHLTVAMTRGDVELEIEARLSSHEHGIWTPLP